MVQLEDVSSEQAEEGQRDFLKQSHQEHVKHIKRARKMPFHAGTALPGSVRQRPLATRTLGAETRGPLGHSPPIW